MSHHSSGNTLAGARPASNRALGVLTLASGLSAAIFATYALHSALPSNAINLPFEHSAHVREWFPEGWAFFTAPAQREQTVPFSRVRGEWISSNAGPNAKWSNELGMSRSARIQALEISMLTQQVGPDEWASCNEANASCFEHATAHVVSNRSLRRTLCGDVVISVAKPVPWAWSHLETPVAMPARVLRMDVRC